MILQILFPWLLARRWFEPEAAGYVPGFFQRIAGVRALVGTAFIIYLSWPYQGVGLLLQGFLGSTSMNVLIASGTAALTLLIFWLVRAPLSRDVRSATLSGLYKATLALVCMGAVNNIIVNRIGVLLPFLGILWMVWLIAFVLSIGWYCLRWTFGVSDADRLLGPIVGAATAVVALVYNEVVGRGIFDNFISRSTIDPTPTSVQIMIKGFGLLTVCALAAFEFSHEVRARHGRA